MTGPRRPMTPVTITRRARNMRTRAVETWAAESVERAPDDGPLYRYERTDADGTPWEIVHTPTGLTGRAGTLAEARADTARPGYVEWLRRDAEQAAAGVAAAIRWPVRR